MNPDEISIKSGNDKYQVKICTILVPGIDVVSFSITKDKNVPRFLKELLLLIFSHFCIKYIIFLLSTCKGIAAYSALLAVLECYCEIKLLKTTIKNPLLSSSSHGILLYD